jgi:hypothetical protein
LSDHPNLTDAWSETPLQSKAVTSALRAGYTSLCNGAVAVSWLKLISGRKVYRQVIMLAGDRRVEVSVSPAGRSVRIWVDGVEIV